MHQKLRTLVAQPYPAGLARDIAAQLLDHSRKSALCCTSSCACQSCSRIGEAKNPGPPRRRLVSRTGELDAVPLVSERTVALQQRVWDKFRDWLHGRLCPATVASLFTLPSLVALFLAEFGTELYRNGEPIHLFRHLVASAPRKIIGIKPYLSVSWDMLSRWEIVEPAEHRVPVPEVVVHAMLAIALGWGWDRFAGTLALIFYSIARPGEVLRGFRSQLALPRDLLATDYSSPPRPWSPSTCFGTRCRACSSI